MKTEYEAKFLQVDIEAVRQKLVQHGAELMKPMRLMRRVTIENPLMLQKGGFVRVRDEGDRATLTYKQFNALSVDGTQEHEVVVSDFEETIALLAATGLVHNSFQESRRETWRLGAVEIVIDEWPWLRPYIEIEAGSEAEVRELAERLGFSWEDAVFGDVMAAYRAEYPHLNETDTVASVPEVRFSDPLPDLLRV